MFFQAICRTGIFMICAQAIVHFRPQESYEKYLKLLVSAMVLIQLFLPIANLFAGGSLQEAAAELTRFQESLEQAMEEAQEAAVDTTGQLEQMTLEEVRKRMEEQETTKGESGGQKEKAVEPSQGVMEEGAPVTQKETSSGNRAVTVEIEPVEPVQIEVK